jgi:hypothetical protein
MGAELFRVDGETNTTKLRVAFRNFADAPKKGKFHNFNFVLRETRGKKNIRSAVMKEQTECVPRGRK